VKVDDLCGKFVMMRVAGGLRKYCTNKFFKTFGLFLEHKSITSVASAVLRSASPVTEL
jgi:hypothetical protein